MNLDVFRQHSLTLPFISCMLCINLPKPLFPIKKEIKNAAAVSQGNLWGNVPEMIMHYPVSVRDFCY